MHFSGRMRGAWLLPLAVSFTLHGISALTLHRRDIPSVVSLDIQRKDVADPAGRDQTRRKRDQTVDQSLDNEGTLYFCNITIGTPEQNLRLVLDTGSSDLWCNAADSTLCLSRGDPCSTSGSYDQKSSSTYKHVSYDFNITYADGSGAAGEYVTDTMQIGDVEIENFQFGVGDVSSSAEGVLGLGYVSNEVQVDRFGRDSYPNLPRAMVEKGLIKSNAYSLWLNDLEANTGSILFGGVNKAKYHGDLQTLPVQPVNGGYSEFFIALTGLDFASDSKSHSYSSKALPAAVLLDSGSSLTYLPNTLAEDIYKDLDVFYDTSSGVGYVPCSLANENIHISYTFSSPTINVGIDELVLKSGPLHFRDGTPACVFGIVPAGDSTAVLGDTFLRSAYVVYDLANNEISLASTNFNASDDDILEIGSGQNSVPGATQVSNPVTSISVDDGSDARIGGPTGGVSSDLPKSGTAATTELVGVKRPLLYSLATLGVGYILSY